MSFQRPLPVPQATYRLGVAQPAAMADAEYRAGVPALCWAFVLMDLRRDGARWVPLWWTGTAWSPRPEDALPFGSWSEMLEHRAKTPEVLADGHVLGFADYDEFTLHRGRIVASHGASV